MLPARHLAQRLFQDGFEGPRLGPGQRRLDGLFREGPMISQVQEGREQVLAQFAARRTGPRTGGGLVDEALRELVLELEADPLGPNARLGTYTNFVNLLDLAALAVPGPFRPDGLPAGLTLIAPRGSDARLAALGLRFQAAGAERLAA